MLSVEAALRQRAKMARRSKKYSQIEIGQKKEEEEEKVCDILKDSSSCTENHLL